MDRRLNIWNVLIVLSILGICLASYLFYNFLTKPTLEACYVNSIINCDAVTKGSLSALFGVPVSLVGLAGYIVILLSSIFKKKKTVLAMSTFGMLFCLYITFQEVFFLRVLCPVCLTCQFVMLLVFIIALSLNLSTKKSTK
jgi:uncharacterized membrane protein